MAINGINHITLKTRDIDRAEEFYTKVLGLKKVGQRPHMRFYSSGNFNHELALIDDPSCPKHEQSALVHICFNVSDEASFYALYKHCQEMGQVSSELVNHTIMYSFYLRSPDGYTIEIGIDRPRREWQEHPHPFSEDSLLQAQDKIIMN
jgi:catechol 2,3-dioxygenase